MIAIAKMGGGKKKTEGSQEGPRGKSTASRKGKTRTGQQGKQPLPQRSCVCCPNYSLLLGSGPPLSKRPRAEGSEPQVAKNSISASPNLFDRPEQPPFKDALKETAKRVKLGANSLNPGFQAPHSPTKSSLVQSPARRFAISMAPPSAMKVPHST